jgi:SAM-dependent methyltransferase
MNRLYFLDDPWKLKAPEELFRFQETVRVIRDRVGDHFRRILEIGCGEGRQTRHLAPLAEQIIGLDPSSIAIKRARACKIANSLFQVGDLMTYPIPLADNFDVVTACEVLYYVQDLERAYERLNILGRHCVVTYYQGAFKRLDTFFAKKSVQSETIECASCKWRIVYWEQGRY